MTILSVAYPCAPVGPDSVGGAEQILSLLDEAVVEAGHESLVVACEGSEAIGRLITSCRPGTAIDDGELERMQSLHGTAIESVLSTHDVDLVHFHGIDFQAYLPSNDVPALATLHLPLGWYAPEVFRLERPNTYLNCVSESQRRTAPAGAELLPCIENGVPTEGLPKKHARRPFVISLGRICPEKGYEHAMDASGMAGILFLLAGMVYPYGPHKEYFQREIEPRLGASRKFIGPIGLERKQRLLSAARAVLIPSLAWETSSLVAMEAFACGTPVIAYPKGALPEIIEHGKTGFIVNGIPEMADAIEAVADLDPNDCLEAARTRFSVRRMTDEYMALYEKLAATGGRRERRDERGIAAGGAWSAPTVLR